MTVVSPISRSSHRATRTVTVAGVPWPAYKLEALALGLVVAAALLLITGSAQFAVLSAAAVAALRWIAGAASAADHRHASSPRERRSPTASW
ncbi:hypothetical protein AB0L57_17575 [Nocardia sp. NPDC052254]|uniref:hypothetical protein n=1 Tax=Nocardia sp. NPDC052254 TaxID=3155681 RepID=UPI0034331DA1